MYQNLQDSCIKIHTFSWDHCTVNGRLLIWATSQCKWTVLPNGAVWFWGYDSKSGSAETVKEFDYKISTENSNIILKKNCKLNSYSTSSRTVDDLL